MVSAYTASLATERGIRRLHRLRIGILSSVNAFHLTG